VPQAFTDDADVMLPMMAHNGYGLRDASDRLRNDKPFLLRALDAGLYYDAIEGELRNDRDIVLQAVRSQPHQFEGMPEAFRADREVALAAVSRKGYGYNIRHCPEALRDDEELALAAIRFDGPACLAHVSQRLRDDRAFLLKAVKTDPGCLEKIIAAMDADDAFLNALKVAADAGINAREQGGGA
jgi:hypothetical protein